MNYDLRCLKNEWHAARSQIMGWNNPGRHYSITAKNFVSFWPNLLAYATQESRDKGTVTAQTYDGIKDVLRHAENCFSAAADAGDVVTKNNVRAGLIHARAALAKLECEKTVPYVDATCSDRFLSAVCDVIGGLPSHVQQKIADRADFVELSSEGVQGITTAPNPKRQTICIPGNLSDAAMKKTIAHEAAHVYLNHTEGGVSAELEANKLALCWGYK